MEGMTVLELARALDRLVAEGYEDAIVFKEGGPPVIEVTRPVGRLVVLRLGAE